MIQWGKNEVQLSLAVRFQTYILSPGKRRRYIDHLQPQRCWSSWPFFTITQCSILCSRYGQMNMFFCLFPVKFPKVPIKFVFQLSLPGFFVRCNGSPFSPQGERVTISEETGQCPLDLMDAGLSFEGEMFDSIVVIGSSEAASCCLRISMRLNDGTSPLQYLCHILRYVDSRPRMKFGPSQTGDFDIRSRRLILKLESAVTSDASCNANFTYSSSFLAIRCPKPALKHAKCQIFYWSCKIAIIQKRIDPINLRKQKKMPLICLYFQFIIVVPLP